MKCQNLKVKLVRDMNIERYLLEKYPRRIVNRRHTVVQGRLAQLAQPAQRAPVGKRSSVPIGVRGRKRLSLDIKPATSKSTDVVISNSFTVVSPSNAAIIAPILTEAVNINLDDAIVPNELNVQIEFMNTIFGRLHYSSYSSDSDISSEPAIIDLDDTVDPDEHSFEINFLDPNFGRLSD